MATALTDLPTEVLQKQAATFGTILKSVGAIAVLFVMTMGWLIATRGWHTKYLLSFATVMAMIALSASAMRRLASIKLELERRQGAR
jgi:hypothetical protein